MLIVIRFVIMPEESVIETELQNDRYQRQRNHEQRQHTERACGQLARVDWYQHQPERAVDNAADAEDQRVLNCLFDFVVYRDLVSYAERKVPGMPL